MSVGKFTNSWEPEDKLKGVEIHQSFGLKLCREHRTQRHPNRINMQTNKTKKKKAETLGNITQKFSSNITTLEEPAQ